MTTCKLWLCRKEIEINETYDIILSKIGEFIPQRQQADVSIC